MAQLIWRPVACSLQLAFRPSPAVCVGDTYTGVSAIRYRREPPRPETPSPNHSLSGLHFHAVTAAATGPHSPLASMKPLTVQGYRLARLHPTAPLKVASVVEVASSSGSTGVDTAVQPAKGNKVGKKAAAATAASPHAPSSNEDDMGSKLVRFDGMEDSDLFPDGTEVELTVTFTGHVQDGEQGGVYVPSARHRGGASTASSSPAPLLTHFEITLARWCFPCPDDPTYRLDWTLQSLQLPAGYATVVTNGPEESRRVIRGAGGDQVQLGFGPVGPLPAYVIAFAAYPGEDPLNAVSTEMELLPPGHYLRPEGSEAEAVAPRVIPVSVLAAKGSGITEATLRTTLDCLVDSVRYVNAFFHCPLPLCGCTELRVLLCPTVPYLSGMEHHGCVFLNEAIFTDSTAGGGGGGAASAGGKGAEAAALVRAELVGHETVHHAVGNRIGFSFAVKEGVCQVLEQLCADAFLGRPPRKLVTLSGSTGGGGGGCCAAVSGSGKMDLAKGKKATASGGGGGDSAAVRETEKGKEFTGRSYQQALVDVQNAIVAIGVGAFQVKMQALMQGLLVRPAVEEETYGGREAMRMAGVAEAATPYFTVAAFLEFLAKPAEEEGV